MKSKSIIILGFIGVLSALLRIVALDQVPPSLNWDEVSHGYNAYSILTTGKDEWGISFPLTAFRAFGDYKLPLYIYLTAPLTLFGLSEWTVRLVSALSGVGAVIFTFFLVQKLFKNSVLSLISALLLAVSPWSILLSRAAFEANLALFLLIFASWLFFKGLERIQFLPFAFVIYGLSLYAYNSAKIFVPFLIIVLIILYRRDLLKHLKLSVASISLFILFFIPHLVLLPSSEGQARFYWSTIIDQGAINQINEARTASSLPGTLPTLTNNKPVYFTTHFFINWASHYSPKFLFFEGGSNYQYSIPGRGIVYPVLSPFLLIGLVALVIWRKKEAFLILIWLLLGPIASAITRESPHLLRSIFTLPALQIVTAFGIVSAAKYFGKVKSNYYFTLIAIVTFLLFLSVGNFLVDYFGKYRRGYSFAWQYGYKDVAKFIESDYHSYDQIIMTKKYGEPHEFLLFYLKKPPEKYQNDPNLIRFYQSNWYWVDRFDKFYFVNDWDIPSEENARLAEDSESRRGKWLMESGETIPIEGETLLVTSPGNAPPDWEHLKTVNFLDDQPAFEIYQNEETKK